MDKSEVSELIDRVFDVTTTFDPYDGMMNSERYECIKKEFKTKNGLLRIIAGLVDIIETYQED